MNNEDLMIRILVLSFTFIAGYLGGYLAAKDDARKIGYFDLYNVRYSVTPVINDLKKHFQSKK